MAVTTTSRRRTGTGLATRPGFVALVTLMLCAAPLIAAETGPAVSAREALARLKMGNARFVRGTPHVKDILRARKETSGGQRPYAIILTCSDSRVPPELVFDETLGRLFVVRVAGEVVDPVVLGSIEYAVEHLHAHLLVVLGHESCGAVKAALDGGHASANVAALIDRIAPAVPAARAAGLGPEGTLSAAVRQNVRLQMESAIKESPILGEAVHKGTLEIVGGVYHLHRGSVEFLPVKEVNGDGEQERRSPGKSGDLEGSRGGGA